MRKSLTLLAFMVLFAACTAEPTATSAPTPDAQTYGNIAITPTARSVKPTATPAPPSIATAKPLPTTKPPADTTSTVTPSTLDAPDQSLTSTNQKQSNIEAYARYPVWEQNCSGEGTVQFANSPLDLENISLLSPYGQVVGGHVTPIDHMYLSIMDPSLGRDAYEVKAIQDGVIFDVQRRDINAENNQAQLSDWRVDIGHTCTFVSYLDLMTSLAPEIESLWALTEGGRTGRWEGIPVTAGQVIGYVGEHAIDFGVYDYAITLPGFINPSAYFDREPWKVHTVDPFPYFPAETREALLAKMIRGVEPRAGKIDYDIPGAFSGNWFELGTDWYTGVNQRKYWEGHLSIAPNDIDPSLWIIAVGALETEENNFVMLGDSNQSEPALGLGPVSYDLKQYMTYIPAKPSVRWWTQPIVEGDVYGVKFFPGEPGAVLLEMPEPGLLKAEVFLGMASSGITGFTDAARLYSR